MIGLGLGLGLTQTYGGTPTPTPTPWTVDTIVIEGDSMTSNMPSTPSDTYYSYQYVTSRPDLTIEVRAQGSRIVGAVGDLDDDSNSLIGNVSEDMAYEPDLITASPIGANDMAASVDATGYETNLQGWYNAVKAARPGCRVAWSAPIPYNPDASHPNYADFTARRAVVMETARDPATWGQWCDYYIPMGEHPDFVELGSSLYADSVHPTGFDETNGTGGQNRLYDQYKAAVDTIADAARVNSSTPYESVWPAAETGLATTTQIVRRFIVSGVAHKGLTSGISVSGGDAEVRLNGGAYGSSIGRIYNGDVIDLRLTTSSAHETAVAISLTIGGETREITYTTGADAVPVTYAHGGILNVQPQDTVHTFPAVNIADNGLAVLGIMAANGNASVALTPTGGGTTISGTQIKTQATAFSGTLEVWSASVAAGTYDIVVTASAWRGQTTMSYGVVQGANATPAQVVSNAPVDESAPHLTPAYTVPVNGLDLAFFGEYGGASITPATANSPTVLIDEGNGEFQSATNGVALGSIGASGQASFDFAFGTLPRIAVVFEAGGS